MPVLYKIDDNDSDKVLKDKLRKILDNLSHQISNSDGSIQSINTIISNITSTNGGSVGLVNHAFTHEDGGQDEIKLDDLAAPDDNTDLDASISAHGLLKKLSNVVTEFLNGQGSFSVPDHDALTNFVSNEHLPGIDEDDMVSNSDVHVPTQQSVKAYVSSSASAPGGSDTHIQFNDAGAFGGEADFVWDKTNNRLGIGEASPAYNIEVTHTSPTLVLHNSTHTNSAGGRKNMIHFRGEKADGTEHDLATIDVGHNTSDNNEKAYFNLSINTGSGLYQRLYFLGTNEARLTGRLAINYGGGTDDAAFKVSAYDKPYIWITNNDAEDGDEQRESRIYFRGTGTGFQYDDTLAMIEANHDGTGTDQKGNLIFKTNDGSDNDAPTERMRIDSNGLVTIEGDVGSPKHVLIQNDAVNVASDYYGLQLYHVKTDGVTDEDDIFIGLNNSFRINDTDQTHGNFWGIYNDCFLIAGTIGTVGSNKNLMAMELNYGQAGGTINGNLFGLYIDGSQSGTLTGRNYDIWIENNPPKIGLINDTNEDTEGGRESYIDILGRQSGSEISVLARIRGSHDGTGDDEKGDLIFYTNDGSDGDSPTERMRIDSAGAVILAAMKSGATQAGAGAAANEIWKTASHATLPDNVLMIGA